MLRFRNRLFSVGSAFSGEAERFVRPSGLIFREWPMRRLQYARSGPVDSFKIR